MAASVVFARYYPGPVPRSLSPWCLVWMRPCVQYPAPPCGSVEGGSRKVLPRWQTAAIRRRPCTTSILRLHGRMRLAATSGGHIHTQCHSHSYSANYKYSCASVRCALPLMYVQASFPDTLPSRTWLCGCKTVHAWSAKPIITAAFCGNPLPLLWRLNGDRRHSGAVGLLSACTLPAPSRI